MTVVAPKQPQQHKAERASSNAAVINWRRRLDVCVLATTASICMIIAIATALQFSEATSIEERRALAPFPRVGFRHLADFTPQFESFFNDRLFGRTRMASFQSWLKYKLCGTTQGTKVIAGSQGWLYLVQGWVGADVRREKPITVERMERWGRVLQHRTQWFAQRGIKYIMVVAPNKDSIFPEFLPTAFRPIRDESKLQQLTKYLSKQAGVSYIDFSNDLKISKAEDGQIYHKTDTHWNDIGAFIACHRLILELSQHFPQLKPIEKQDLQVQYNLSSGDLVDMSGLKGMTERVPVVRIANPPPKTRLKAIFIHDSFGPSMLQYLRPHFSSFSTQLQSEVDFDMEAIAKQKPDIVIQEVVERHVTQLEPTRTNWSDWIIKTITEHQSTGSGVWLNIVPNTSEINIRTFKKASQLPGCAILPTTDRISDGDWRDNFKFDETSILSQHWFALKTGSPGMPLAGGKSAENYARLNRTIQTSPKFVKVGTLDMADGSKLLLYSNRVGWRP